MSGEKASDLTATFVVSLLGGGTCQIIVVPATLLESRRRSPSEKATPVTAAGCGRLATSVHPLVDQMRAVRSPDATAR